MILNLIFGITLSVGLTACGLHPTSDDTNQNTRKEESDRQKLRETFGQIQGWYEGNLTTTTRTQVPTRIALFYVEIPNGKNSEGETKYLPVLKARYLRDDKPEDAQVLEARYVAESGDLTLSSRTDANGRPEAGAEYIYINGKLLNGRFFAEVKNLVGAMGTLDLTLMSRDVNSPTGGEREDRYARLRERMRELEGTFIGIVEETAENRAHQVELRFTVTEVQSGNDFVPTLIGWFKRTDDISKTVRMTVRYSTDTQPARLVLDSQSPTENFNFNGTFENGIISGTIQFPRFTSRLVTEKKRP